MDLLLQLVEWLGLNNANVRYVLAGVILLGASTAVVGTFTFLRKKSLLGDAIAHAVLPGICLAFILFNTKNPFVLLIGAAITGWLSTVVIDVITAKSRIKPDTAIALVLSVFFGTGMLLLTSIQHSGNAAQSGLDHFLFGKAAALIGIDVLMIAIVSVVLLIAVLIYFKAFTLISFDKTFAYSLGVPVALYEIILSTLTVLAICVGIQAVGVVLMAALLITPAATARYWTNSLPTMLLLAVLFSILASVGGVFVSYAIPAMPTGPWIIVFISIFAFISILVAPARGILPKIFKGRKTKEIVYNENILKCLYHLGEAENNFEGKRNITDIQQRRFFNIVKLKQGLAKLRRADYITETKNSWALTEMGTKEGARIARLHRLWELYLNTFLKMPKDHVHQGAEVIEHFITPEIEEMLLAELNNPTRDPHDREIPY
mgnify:CR=1 FL=1